MALAQVAKNREVSRSLAKLRDPAGPGPTCQACSNKSEDPAKVRIVLE